jgi:rod shape-determining protein MreC
MLKIIKRIAAEFKEYILLVVLLLVSLFFLSNSNKPQIKRLQAAAFENFSFVNSFFSGVGNLFASASDLKEMKRQNAELMLRLDMLRQYEAENKELKKMLQLRDSVNYSLQPATIVSKLPARLQGSFIINAGSSEKIEVGMPVITSYGLIGLVADVDSSFSVVKTIRNASLNVAVTDQRSRVNGILSWDGRDLVIRNIPATMDIQAGDIFSTSEFSTILPPSIPVGKVLRQQTNFEGLMKDVYIESFTDFQFVKNVFVVKLIFSKQINNLELNLFKNKE